MRSAAFPPQILFLAVLAWPRGVTGAEPQSLESSLLKMGPRGLLAQAQPVSVGWKLRQVLLSKPWHLNGAQENPERFSAARRREQISAAGLGTPGELQLCLVGTRAGSETVWHPHECCFQTPNTPETLQ